MDTDTILHDITLLERQLHGIITQRERLGVNNKELNSTEDELKKRLVEKKQLLRSIMEAGEPPNKPPRQPALIKNGVALEMLAQIVQIEDKLCSALPVLEVEPLDPLLLAECAGPAVVTATPDDGAPNRIVHPPPPPSSSPSSSSSSSSSSSALLAACSLSTYPHVQQGPERQGDPVCDRFNVHVHKNGVVVALADGCNWGRLPFDAANKSTSAFIQYLEERLAKVTSLRGAGSLLLAALSAADKKITEGIEKWEAGTTTLIGGLLLPLTHTSSQAVSAGMGGASSRDHPPPLGSLPRSSSWSSSNSLSLLAAPASPGRTRAGSTSLTSKSAKHPGGGSTASPKWVFICASLGDCKAFHYSQRSHTFTDITEGNRQNLTDARDPGGRLGPYIEGGPDLRNLHLYFQIAEQDDFIFLMSDGVHDNLDPQQLGITPSEAKIDASTWEEAEKVDPNRVEVFKNSFRRKWLEDTFSKHLFATSLDATTTTPLSASSSAPTTPTSVPTTPTSNIPIIPKLTSKLDVKTVVDVLLRHCVDITKTSRDFMEQNPKQKLPSDFKTYPGKLDHATCVCFRVGHNET